MANQWFRLYHEFATDPKIQMLSESDQRRFVMILCLKCSNVTVTLHDFEVAFQLRISNDEWLQTKRVFIEKNLINELNEPVAWDRRQYTSDSSAERVARHRERMKRSCNVTVTPPDTYTDTNTESYTEVKDIYCPNPPKNKSEKPKKNGIDTKIPEKMLLSQYGIEDQLAVDFMAHRKSKKAPITETVMKCFKAESEKAGLSLQDAIVYTIKRGWQGFESDWYLRNNSNKTSQEIRHEREIARNKELRSLDF